MSYLSIWAQGRQGLSPWPAARPGSSVHSAGRMGGGGGGRGGRGRGGDGPATPSPALSVLVWVAWRSEASATGSILGRVLDSKGTVARACCAKMDTVLLEQEGAYLRLWTDSKIFSKQHRTGVIEL